MRPSQSRTSNTHALSSDFHEMGPNKWFVLELMPSNLFVVIWVVSYDYAKYYQILLFPECSMCPNTDKALAASGTQSMLAYAPLWRCDPETPLWVCKQLAHWEAEFGKVQYETMAQSQGEADSRW